jgi:hypothetical protein
MQITTKILKNKVLKLHLTMPYDYAIIAKELKNELWTEHARSYQRANDGVNFRAVLPTPQSPILKEILDFVSSDEIKKQLIDQLYEDFPSIANTWEGWDSTKMFNVTTWGGQFLKDIPGYQLEKHLDTRLQIATGLIYFTEKDNPDWSTTYYTDQTGTDKIRIENNFCDGVLHINDYDTWHEGWNRSTQDRYLLIIGLILNVK